MKPPTHVNPHVTITVTGRPTHRMTIGLCLMKLGARLIQSGGMRVNYTRGGNK